MSVIDKYKDMGTIVMGKSEAGIVRKGDRLYVMPNKCARTRCKSTNNHCFAKLHCALRTACSCVGKGLELPTFVLNCAGPVQVNGESCSNAPRQHGGSSGTRFARAELSTTLQ